MTPMLPLHEAHSYRTLMRRWRELARRLGLRLQTLAVVEDLPVFWLETGAKGAMAGEAAVYLSSGVHGDEPGAAWGLLVWAEENVERLRAGRFLIFPCLNPHGLQRNTRVDHLGQDLNRRFHVTEDAVCGPWRQVVAGRRLAVGLCLHEDYDGQGCYVYELGRRGRPRLAPEMLAGVRAIPPDGRRRIDESRAAGGVIHKSRVPKHLPGMPEAVVLHELGCGLTLTFETPSEFGLDVRVRAQVEFVNAVLSGMRIAGNTGE
ncbi:MAG: M14 family metallocarboxypeptidase [Verrucomicrobiota bacterium]